MENPLILLSFVGALGAKQAYPDEVLPISGWRGWSKHWLARLGGQLLLLLLVVGVDVCYEKTRSIMLLFGDRTVIEFVTTMTFLGRFSRLNHGLHASLCLCLGLPN